MQAAAQPQRWVPGVNIMIAFEIIVNGTKLCNAGIEGLGVLSAILSWAHRVPEPEAELNLLYPPDELLLEVGGP
jgi:hypothetical protein